MSIIELDDHGEFWNRNQLRHALGQVNAAQTGTKEKVGAIVVVFVHGWKNNASPRNEQSGNLHSFMAVLDKIDTKEKKNASPRQVVGIYLAWRGNSTPVPLVKEFSFWDRIGAGTRIASAPAATEALLAVLGQAKGNQLTKTVVVGHSFGGLIVEKALSQALVERSIYSVFKEQNPDGSYPVLPTKYPADLVVLVNPAAPGIFSRSLMSALQEWKLTSEERPNPSYICNQSREWRPVIVSITSRGDWGTGILFPIGSALSSITKRFRAYQYHDGDPEAEKAQHSQRYYYTHTEGHIDELISHTVSHATIAKNNCGVGRTTCPCPENPCTKSNEDQASVCYISGSSQFVITRNANRNINRNSPYWVMQVPKSVVKNHTSIFGDSFTEMLTGLLDMTNVVRVEASATP